MLFIFVVILLLNVIKLLFLLKNKDVVSFTFTYEGVYSGTKFIKADNDKFWN